MHLALKSLNCGRVRAASRARPSARGVRRGVLPLLRTDYLTPDVEFLSYRALSRACYTCFEAEESGIY